MTEVPPVPSSRADAVEHADYLEFLALTEDDRSASIHDLGRDITQSGGLGELPENEDGADPEEYPSDRGGERVQELTRVATDEIERRFEVCGSYYPFDLDSHGVLEAREGADMSVYTFLLLLTVRSYRDIERHERKLFEKLSTEVAAAYLGGDRFVVSECFGSPRDPSAGFEEALKNLCHKMGEGTVKAGLESIGEQQDGGVDVVAMRRFPDRRIGQLAMFGQCATGQDWQDKLSDLQPKVFMNLWMSEQLAVDPIRALFVPVAIENKAWRKVAMTAGVPFDRTRITHHASSLPSALLKEIEGLNAQALTTLRHA